MGAEQTLKKQSKLGNKEPTLPARFVPRFIEEADARIATVKLIKSRYETLKVHCGGGDSAQRDLLCRRIAFVSIVLETAEVTALEKGTVDLGSYTQSVNCLVGLLRAVGLDRKVKNVTDLKSYLREKQE